MNCVILFFSAVLFCIGSVFASVPRISLGSQAKDDQFPWHVSISFLDKSAKLHYCGGSILSEKWILTAAHCVSHHSEVTLSFGSLNLTAPHQIMTSDHFHIFPAYDFRSSLYDLALIKLPNKLEFTRSIQPVELPPLSQNEETFENRTAFLSGFGRRTPEGNVSSTLHWIQLKTIPNHQCANTYKELIRPSILCTMGWSQDEQSPCFGDSGGALVIKENEKWIQIGVMAFIQQGGCTPSTPAGYMRVTFLQDWISEITEISWRD